MPNAADDTRRRLLEAAGEVFAAKGFQAATVREICNRAEANLAAVNYHFGDKQRLYVETVRHAQCCGAEQPPPQWPPVTPPAEKLRQYVCRMLTSLLDARRPEWHARLMAREMNEPTQACRALLQSHVRPYYESLNGILSELVPRHMPDADRHLIAFSIIGQCLHYKIHKSIAEMLVGEEEYRTYDIDRLTEHITRFSLAALGYQRPASAAAIPPSTLARP